MLTDYYDELAELVASVPMPILVTSTYASSRRLTRRPAARSD